MSTSMKDKETKGFGRIAKRIRGLIEDFVVSLTIDSLDGDGRAEILKRLIREIEQLEQEAERRGYKKGIELEQLRNAEFFEEDYQNKERLEELESELKLLEEENGKQNAR